MNVSKTVFLILGFVFLLLGLIGVFLPLLPTTPFLLLASICFARSSDKFHNWLLSHPFLGPPIQQWKERKAIAVRFKALATVMMAISAGTIWLYSSAPIAGKIALTVFLSILGVFIWTRNSK